MAEANGVAVGQVVRALRAVVLGVVGLAAAVIILAVALGWRPVVLLSGSMSPTAPTGSLVVASPVDGERVLVGDVVTVTWPGATTPVTHRVVAIERGEDGAVLATTKGDANDEVDQQLVRLDGTRVLRARAYLPGAGRAFVGNGPRALAGGAAVLGALLAMIWLWRPIARPAPRSVATTPTTDPDDAHGATASAEAADLVGADDGTQG